jgi:hypothetical protein
MRYKETNMKIAYIDCIGGVSGDMLMGAFIDAGVDPDVLREELEKLGLRGWDLSTRHVKKAGMVATKADVSDSSKPVERNLLDILKLIAGSGLKAGVKKKAAGVFEVLATAEGAAHGTVPATVHFHEVGAIDAIVDVAGTIICLDLLGIEKLYVSPLRVSQPAAATAHIIKTMRVEFVDFGIESVTPTGAALVKSLGHQVAKTPAMIVEKVANGAGQADTEKPNIVRVLIGEAETPVRGKHDEEVYLLESNIDDMSPEALSYAMNRLFEAGAADVWFTPVTMKKGRPAFVLSSLCETNTCSALTDAYFRETGTLGLRLTLVNRKVLHRETITVNTHFGDIRIKTGWYNGAAVSIKPEFEDCSKAAKKHNRRLNDVYEAALRSLSNS